MDTYGIGTEYETMGRHKIICTVIDILKTYNSKNELVSIRYVATHKFLGQTITDNNVVNVTIARGLIKRVDGEIINDRC